MSHSLDTFPFNACSHWIQLDLSLQAHSLKLALAQAIATFGLQQSFKNYIHVMKLSVIVTT